MTEDAALALIAALLYTSQRGTLAEAKSSALELLQWASTTLDELNQGEEPPE
jgi:hypothetical protein